MASLTLPLLHLLLMVSAASAQNYRYYGGSVTFTSKRPNSDSTYEVELRDKQTTVNCNQNAYACYYGDCGSQIQTTNAFISSNSYGLSWCQYEKVTTIKLNSNLPFAIRYPSYYDYSLGKGYWVENIKSSQSGLEMMAHVDLGTRSDTGRSNSPPVTTILSLLRVPRNCPRSFNTTVFDPDGDQVRCRVPTDPSTRECGLCGVTNGFSLDQNSCSLTFSPTYSTGSGYYPIELVVEDFPHNHITLSYSDGSSTSKRPFSGLRRKRQINSKAPTTTTTKAPTTTTTTKAPTTSTTKAPTTTTTTKAPTTTTTKAPTTTTTTEVPPTYTTTEVPPTYTTTEVPPTYTTTEVPPTYTTTEVPPTYTTSEAPTTYTTTEVPPTYTTSEAPTTYTTTEVPPTYTTTTTDVPSTTTTEAPTTKLYEISTAPLSKLPLQFSVYVDGYSAPSCIDGYYFPIFLSPTPSNGVNLAAFVNHPLKIKVRSSAQYSTIYDLIVTGPSGISKQRISTEEFVIQWTPSENELNDNFPICFVSEATDRYNQVYQSELRCVVVDVGHHETTVTCSETTITVEVQKDYLIRYNENNLHLNNFTDPSCNLTTLSNSTHLVAVISLNACGTIIEEDEGNIIFRNEITSADPNQIMSGQNDIEIAFLCVYPRRTNLTLGFTHKDIYKFTDKAFGTFTFQFEFYESQLFLNPINASSYPVEVDLAQMMFMQIEIITPIPNVELFVESCRATPYDNPNSRISYSIIENGCVKDKTVQIYPGSQYQFRFGMQAFEFIGAYPQVDITCSVILCETGVPGTRCSQGCITSDYRHRREAALGSSRHSISLGPLRLLKASASQASGLSMNLGLNLVFIVSCLLVCGVVVYRSKRPQVKYQLLPMSDPD